MFDLGSVAVSSICMGSGVHGSANGSLCGSGFKSPCVQVSAVFFTVLVGPHSLSLFRRTWSVIENIEGLLLGACL